MRLAIILASLVAIANAGSPEFDMINNVPDRTVVRFSVDLAIYCGEYGASQPFQCDIQLREASFNIFTSPFISIPPLFIKFFILVEPLDR